MAKTTKGRVVVPSDPESRIKLAEKVFAKHQADGAASKLNDLEGADWAVTGPEIAACLALHDEAERLKGQMEAAYRNRDAKLKGIDNAVTLSKNLLKGIYSTNPKKLAEWGFEINDTPKAKKTTEPPTN